MDTAFIGKVGDDDLGAALELVPEDLKPEWFEGWDYFHIEGYLVQNQATIRRAVELAKAAGWKVAEGLFLVLGIVLGIVVCTLSPTRTPDALWFVFIAGAIAICAMILPGVSGSFILLILGKYKFIMAAITAFVSNAGALWGSDGADAGLFWQSAAVLAVFLVGAVTGILGFSKFLHWLLARWHKQTLIVLAGFIIGSLVKVWPWSNPEALSQVERTGGYQIGWAICFALIGFALVTSIEILGKFRKK